MKNVSLIFLLLPFLINTCFAETAKPESVGMSSERLARIGPMMDRFIEQKGTPGAVTLIARHGKIIHLEGHGKFRDDKDDAMTTDAIFDIASMTKPIANLAALMLVEDEKIGFDDELSQYLPDFKDVQVKLSSGELVPAKEPIRIHDLFRHSSGLGYGSKSMNHFSTVDELIRSRAQLPLQFHPGEYYKSPESTTALGWLVEKVSKQSLQQFLRERIFEPLSMEDTDYDIPAEKSHRDVIPYRDGKSDYTFTIKDRITLGEGELFPASTGLYSTAEDYWKFCQMIMNGGQFEGKRLISQEALQRMLNYSNSLPVLKGDKNDMNLGFNMVGEGSQGPFPVGSYHKGGGRGTHCVVDPNKELISILMIQTVKGDPGLKDHFFELVYAAIVD